MTLNELAGRVVADPQDAQAVRALALELAAAGDKTLAGRALTAAGRLLSGGGQLAMAIVAAKELATLDARAAAKAVDELAAAYGRGSTRVDAAYRAKPPKQAPERAADGKPLQAVTAAEAAAKELGSGPVPRVALFQGLSRAAFAELVKLAAVREVKAGEVVLEIGSRGTSFFLVARGTVRISRPAPGGEEVVLSHLRAVGIFGEMALLTDSPRGARATAETAAILLEVERGAVDKLAVSEQEMAAVLADYTRDRLLANLMLTSGVFAPLGEAARARLVGRFTLRHLEPGEALLSEGEPGGSLHVVLSGTVDVEKAAGAQTLTVTRLGPGDVVWEISLLTRRPATATVRARHKTLALSLGRDDFNAIVADFPEVLSHLYQLAVARERDLERFLSEEVVEADDYLI
jgi:CRP-like cAMP-binding protein